MRSYDRAMPEELNRVLTDHARGLLLCSSEAAVANLHREGVGGAVEVVGDVMVDVARRFAPVAPSALRARAIGVRAGEYVLVTAHRAGTSTRARLAALVALLGRCPRRRCSRCIPGRARGSRRRD